jgi:D-3-phosphoglycerate dehydrogenase
MSRFKVVMVAQDSTSPDWVSAQLEAAGVDFSVHVCRDRDDLTLYASDADLAWIFGGADLLMGENLTALERCGAILRTGSGTDNVDVKTATELGILVVNTPQAVADQVADHAISLLFSLVREITRHDRMVRSGQWAASAAMSTHRRFQGAVMGLVGFGHIPRLVIQKLSGFDMQFVANDPYVTREVITSYGAESVSLDEVLQRSDYVSLHCPLTEETFHLIGEREFRLMPSQVLLINTARGEVVDEGALIKALKLKWIAGAALDVFEQEPVDPQNPLLAMENVIVTPHFAGYSDTTPQEFYEASIEAILDFAQGRWPRSVVNSDVKPRWDTLAPSRYSRDA